jgi:hypothetical protein
VNLGFEGLLATHVDLDLLGLGFGFLASLIFSTPVLWWALTCPGRRNWGSVNERVKLPYCRSTRRKFLFLFLLDLVLAVDGKGIAVDADINVLFVDSRDFKLQNDVVLVFVDVHRRCKAGGC